MNYQQIKALSNGDCLQFLEDYEYVTEFKTFIIPKGTWMVMVGCSLRGYTFRYEGDIEAPCSFGKKRLRKMKLKKIGAVHL